jgi:hypothetical protein
MAHPVNFWAGNDEGPATERSNFVVHQAHRNYATLVLVRFALVLLASLLLADDGVIVIPQVKTELPIGDQTVAVTVGGSVTQVAKPDLYRITLNIDLADFARHLTPLLKPQIDRSEQCGERIDLQEAAIAAAPPGALATVHVHFEKWGCAKALGRQITKRLVGGNAVAQVKFAPLVEFNRVRLESEVGEIQADGSLGELLRSGSLGKALREKIHKSLQSAIEKATNWDATIPKALQEVASFQSIAFTGAIPGQFGLSLTGQVHIQPDRLKTLVIEVNQKSN